MEDKTMFKELKETLKKYAIEIKYLKSKRKLPNRENLSLSEIELKIVQLKYHFRHHHICYCELRGRTREQIEKPSIYNQPNQSYIDKLKKQILEKYETEQAIRSCS